MDNKSSRGGFYPLNILKKVFYPLTIFKRAVTHRSTNIAFQRLTSLIDIYSHFVTYPPWFDTNYDIFPYTYATYKNQYLSSGTR